MENDNAIKQADRLRDAAAHEMHGLRHDGTYPLLDEFSKISPRDMNAVGQALEKGNAIMELSTSPQASISRNENGDVVGIDFHPGRLDFGKDPRAIYLSKF